MYISYTKNHQISFRELLTGLQLKERVNKHLHINNEDYYLVSNGKLVKDDYILCDDIVHVVPRVVGGKGGFGSMLRAIGAQIEKTTNREACRDLSGRRLRDINEEQRLKNWINQQVEREKEMKERRKKKLERLCEKPKHEFKDEEYDKERSKLPELVEDAVLQGLQASCSSKRKAGNEKDVIKKKKPKLWVDDEFDDLSTDEESDSEHAEKANDQNLNDSEEKDQGIEMEKLDNKQKEVKTIKQLEN